VQGGYSADEIRLLRNEVFRLPRNGN